METGNTQKGFPKKLIKTWILIMGLAGALAACGSKGGSSNVAPGLITNCVNCAGITPSTLVTASSSSYAFTASWIWSGDTNVINSTRQQNPYADLYSIYNGPLVITGSINIVSGQMGNCVLPAGNYTITTTSAGTAKWASTGISPDSISPQMLATNGASSFAFSIQQGILYNQGTSFSGYLNVTAVNNIACYGSAIPF